MENSPKFSKLRVVYNIEAFFLVLRAAFLIVSIYFYIGILQVISSLKSSFAKNNSTMKPFSDDDDDYDVTSKSDRTLITGDMVLSLVYYVLASIGFIFLRLGYKKKDHKNLGIFLVISIMVLFILIISEIISWVEETRTGVVPVITFLFLIIYRVVALKIVFDARQELKTIPITVPFVPMRDREDDSVSNITTVTNLESYK